MSSLISVYWESLKNTCTFCEIISLKYINKPQHLCEKVHEQIKKKNNQTLGKTLLKRKKLRKMGQNHLSELISAPSKMPFKSLEQLIRTGVASQAYINYIQDR